MNVSKTKELIFDYRKSSLRHVPLFINGSEVTIVNHFKYLGVVIDNNLTWSFHVNHIVSKCKQRLYFLRLLKSFNVSANVMVKFYSSLIESIICYNISVWGNSLNSCVQKKIERISKLASKVIGVSVPTMSCLYHKYVINKTKHILSDNNHVLAQCYVYMRSGRRLRSVSVRTQRYRGSFVPIPVFHYFV